MLPAEIVSDERLARAAWSLLTEPGDEVAGALRSVLGPNDALDWTVRALAVGRDSAWSGSGAVPAGLLAELGSLVGNFDHEVVQRALARWRRRVDDADPRPVLDLLLGLGGHLEWPGEPGWSAGLDDLGAAAPPCLWVRGSLDGTGLDGRSVAVVGARAATAYGERVAADFGAELAEASFAVVSGGAFGIDVAAHRGALAAGGRTVVLLAGGVDRPYPAAHARLFDAVRSHGGALVSEVPLGWAPMRNRFLLRNRLIAALARGTVVVEAATRSGALSTARHASSLLRPVGAVPGPITSMASAGCHQLLRDGLAVCVTSAAEVAELVGGLGSDALPDPPASLVAADGLDAVARRVLDAVPLRRGARTDSVLRTAGVADREGRSALGLLELGGLVRRSGDQWVREGG